MQARWEHADQMEDRRESGSRGPEKVLDQGGWKGNSPGAGLCYSALVWDLHNPKIDRMQEKAECILPTKKFFAFTNPNL